MAKSSRAVPGRIFISYRRHETAFAAGWLHDRLSHRFGSGQVFKDVNSIEPGDDFADVITTAVSSCEVLLAVIGDRWLTITDTAGKRRIDGMNDFVRLEIETALELGARVIPILIDGAKMPRADDLPASIAGLARRQALELSPNRLDFDLRRLLEALNNTLQGLRAEGMLAATGPDATLMISDAEVWLAGSGSDTLHAKRPPSWERLEEIADGPRAALHQIARDSAARQEATAIPLRAYEEHLVKVVRAGGLMFRTLFFGPDATEELRDLGRALQDLVGEDGPLWLEVMAATHIPWHLLAFPDPADPTAVAPSQILGLRHRITYLPIRGSTRRPPPARSLREDDGPLRVVLAVNRDIDPRLVENQIAAWQRRSDEAGEVLAVTVPLGPDILDALVRNTPPADLIYFFCHARQDRGPGRLGSAAARMEFAQGYKITLEDLILQAPADHRFAAAPLVVLNTVSSAVMPFLPLFLGWGACGVIGTEAVIPSAFAAAWAQEFFLRILDGAPLADATFKLARDFVQRHQNLLGLAYGLHRDGRSLGRLAVAGESLVPTGT